MTLTHKLWRPTLAALLALWLSGCGGGEDDAPPTSPSPPPSLTLSGTAAAGLPLTGTVTLKDAVGVTRSVTIGANGSYTVDASGLTPPLMLRATGVVGGQQYVIHSAAAAVAANDTVNITPLTDLIVANVAGQIAQRHFDNGNFAGLTRAELDAESAALKAKLLPVLQAMQVDAAVDLMRTPFTPLASALDQALDVIRVSVDANTAQATITNLINQLTITDDLAVRAAAEGTPPTLPATGMDTTAADVLAVRTAMNDFFALFRTGLPAAGVVTSHLSPDFLLNGQTGTDFVNEVLSGTSVIGRGVRDIEILSLGGSVARVRLVLLTGAGQFDERIDGWQLAKGQDGVWRWSGNQAVVDFGGGAHAVRNTNGCVSTGYEFYIADYGNAQTATVTELRVTGPGLPAAGMRYRRSVGQDAWEYFNGGANNPYYYRLAAANCGAALGAGIADGVIAAIPDNAVYTLTGYDVQSAQHRSGPTPRRRAHCRGGHSHWPRYKARSSRASPPLCHWRATAAERSLSVVPA